MLGPRAVSGAVACVFASKLGIPAVGGTGANALYTRPGR